MTDVTFVRSVLRTLGLATEPPQLADRSPTSVKANSRRPVSNPTAERPLVRPWRAVRVEPKVHAAS